MIPFAKAHAYGNDFLYVRRDALPAGRVDLPALSVVMCERHTGIGADGLIVYEPTSTGARMTLFNADGGVAEVSGNGVRGLGALLIDREKASPSGELVIETAGGTKRLRHVGGDERGHVFRASMGRPSGLRRETITAAGETVDLVVLNIGNPQAILLGALPDDERFHRLGPAIEHHPAFPNRTNLEFVNVEAPDRLRIRIWERGAGATQSSGTGSCASLIAAAAFGGASRSATVIAPGGPQQVEWGADDEVYLTGWAEVVCEGTWLLPVHVGVR